MPRSKPIYLVLILAALVAFAPRSSAQFKSEAFTNGFGGDDEAPADSAEAMFSLREYFAGLQPIQPKVLAITPLRTKAVRAFMPIAFAGVKKRSYPFTSIRYDRKAMTTIAQPPAKRT